MTSVLHQAIFLLGPPLVGACSDLFLQGILSTQFYNYFSYYRDDKLSLKLAVGGLALLTVLKSIQAFAVIWIMLILNFSDINAAVLLGYTAWWEAGSSIMVAFIGLYVQSYFCFRLYVISRNPWVVAPIACIFIFAFLAISVGTYYRAQAVSPPIAKWFAAHLSAVFTGDVSMTIVTANYLIKYKKNVLPETVGLLNALIRLTFLTAAPAALCAMLNLIFSQIYDGHDKLISAGFNMILPKLYAVSMMWTLNARRTIRASHGSENEMTNPSRTEGAMNSEVVFAGVVSRGTRGTRRDDMELGTFGGIQVHTQMETVQTIDVRDMFDNSKKSGREDAKATSKRDDALTEKR